MPMDPTIGSRLMSTLFEALRTRDAQAQDELTRQKAQNDLDDKPKQDRAYEQAVASFNRKSGAPVSSTDAPAAPVAPANAPVQAQQPMQLQIQTPEFGGQPAQQPMDASAVAPMSVPASRPIFKAPDNFVMGASADINSNPAKVRAAQAAKAFNEARVGNIYADHLAQIAPADATVDPETMALLAQAGEKGHRLMTALVELHKTGAEQRKSALTESGSEYRTLAENTRAANTVEQQNQAHLDDFGNAQANLGVRRGELKLGQDKLANDEATKGSDADEVADFAGRKAGAEKSAQIAVAKKAGVDQATMFHARSAAALALETLKATGSMARAKQAGLNHLIASESTLGTDVAPMLLNQYQVELKKSGFFGGKTMQPAAGAAPAGGPISVTAARQMTRQQRDALRAKIQGNNTTPSADDGEEE